MKGYNMTRTEAYHFTVQMENGKPVGEDSNKVEALREMIKMNNKMVGNFDRKQYVKLQGRGPRKVNGRKYFQSLPLEFATHADVYVYNR